MLAEVEEKLARLEQPQLLHYWGQLTKNERQQLAQQIEALDSSLFIRQRRQLSLRGQEEPCSLSPIDYCDLSGNEEDKKAGLRFLKEGKMGCLLVAGGQGSRLGIDGPKGCLPVTPVAKKSLFQLAAERVAAASAQAGRPLPMAVMTSPENHRQTVAYFSAYRNFGLKAGQLSFFVQEELPLLDQKGDLFLEEMGKIAQAPNGNGNALKQFVEAGLWQQWKEQGIEALNFTVVDNGLADPMDSELLGYHLRKGADVTVKCILREDPKEKVGLLVKKGDKCAVVEYSEVSDSERHARGNDGQLKYRYANISLFCFSMEFVLRAAEEPLPLHPALKAVKYLDRNGETVLANHPIAWKFETFIFDLLPLAYDLRCLLYPRGRCFAPLKETADIPLLQAALQEQALNAWQEVAATPPPPQPFELDACFYYPTESLLKRWRGRNPPKGNYISEESR